MESKGKRQQASDSRQGELFQNANRTNDAMDDDGSPVLDERDLEENQLTEEAADNIEWEEPKGDNP